MLKDTLYEILETQSTRLLGRIVDWSLIGLISLNMLAVIMETVPGFAAQHHTDLKWIETCSILIFSVEYALRLWSCTSAPRYQAPITGRLRFALTPAALIDLLVVLPFYLPLFLPVDLRILRSVRLLRLFSLFKLTRYSESLSLLGNVFRKKREELLIIAFSLIILLVIGSSLIYYAERHAQPDVFSSIPEAMWWGICTVTTVGYGDAYPVTPLGKFIASAMALLGVVVIALPAGVLGSSFIEQMQERRDGVYCERCREQLKKEDERSEELLIPEGF